VSSRKKVCPLFLQSEYAFIPFSGILLGLYLLDAEIKEVEESSEVDLSVEKEMAGADLEDKVL